MNNFNFSKSFVKTFRELVLIFVAVTAALWFENRNQDRQDRQKEKIVLLNMVEALSFDIRDLSGNMRWDSLSISSIDIVLNHFDNNLGYDDSLSIHFQRIAGITKHFPNTAAYAQLRSGGLYLVQDNTLRSAIVKYYESNLKLTEAIEDFFVANNYQNNLIPFMLKHFSYSFIFKPAVPNSYNDLITNKEFRSILQTTKEIFIWKKKRSTILKDSAEELMVMIQKKLEINNYVQ